MAEAKVPFCCLCPGGSDNVTASALYQGANSQKFPGLWFCRAGVSSGNQARTSKSREWFGQFYLSRPLKNVSLSVFQADVSG